MFRNFLKIAGRNILRNKLYTVINVLGLTLGLCVCIVIYTITHYELSFDKHHLGSGRIYRVMADLTESTGDVLHFARVSPQVSSFGKTELSGIEAVTAVIPYNAKITVPRMGKASEQYESYLPGSPYRTTAFAEPEYFDLFQYEWLAGDRKKSLREPFTVVLTEKRAQQYFGVSSLHDVIGRELVYDDSLKVRVSGIVKNPQQNTDLLFTDFISYSTRNFRFSSWAQPDMRAWVFMKLIPGTTVTTINAQLNTLVKKHAGSEARVALRLQSLSDMHFDADIIENPIRTAHRPTLYTLMAIAAFILLLAIINFINLSTAQSLQRAKEVGIRKVLGSNRRLLILQFMTETSLLTLVAVLLAIALVKPVLAAFSSFIPEGLHFDVDGATLLFLFCVTLITSVLAGLYPSRIIAAQLPACILKGNSTNPATGNRLVRKGLIVFQFSVSLIFIIGSIVIAKQLNYTREKDLGFSAEGIITIESPRGEIISRVALLEQEVKQVKGVRRVARQWLSPMSENPRGMKLKFNNTDQKDFWVTQVAGNENFIPLYKIRLLAGRNLERADSVKELVINESLSKLMGDSNPYASLNKILYWNDRPYPVVGVVADFHTASLHDPVTPLCLINRADREGALAIKLSINKSTITEVEAAWKKIYPAAPFNFQFFDETLAQLYARDRQTATLINTAMVVTIFISCIGLFGLVLFTSKKRAKEISIRKVLGAGAGDIMVMLGKEFVILVIIAILIAAPAAWYFMNEWLQGFSYRISIDAWMIGIAGLIGLSVALLTTGYHSIKAAMVNPVENLRGN